ncbi:Uncharacterised protein [Mycobacteroides abscessus subsp. abscessus]|uniref:hypothetical protein n=1 Tax=Mycobacteroides abscessus TaxID=36809 RepID=UPI00092CDCA3|nr:hypothetical protein [Mycobacteroides abscessus]SIH19602.1 Uncharacterised protein [Mycobacteroides abscessus subsp. abscessus]
MKYRVTFNLERVLDDGTREEIAFGNTLHHESIDEAMDEARAQLADEDGCWPSRQLSQG